MILSTVTVQPHEEEAVSRLAAMGFDYVCVRPGLHHFTAHEEWPKTAALVRDAGMKLLLTWPSYADFSDRIDDPRYSFRAHDGRTNTSDWLGQPVSGRLMQFSHWNDEMEEALIASLAEFIEHGPALDGVHINVAHNDRMYPSDWWPFGDRAIEGTTMYWSFDDAARAKWAEHSGGQPMPTHCHNIPEQDDFYRWYQAGWIDRLTRLSDAAIDAGLEVISTWWLPHTRYTPVNMSDGTAGSIEPLEGWRQHVLARGAYPLVMVAHQFGLDEDWPHWYADGVESIRQATASPFEWDLIVGAEADISPEITAPNIRKHGRLAAEWGAKGLLCGDSQWLGGPYAADVHEALGEVRPYFEGA